MLKKLVAAVHDCFGLSPNLTFSHMPNPLLLQRNNKLANR